MEFFFGMIAGFFVIFISACIIPDKPFAKSKNKPALKRPRMKYKQVSPKYYGYSGGYSGTTLCTVCGIMGLREDRHPVDPCKQCGGKIEDGYVAYWSGYQWEPASSGKCPTRLFPDWLSSRTQTESQDAPPL